MAELAKNRDDIHIPRRKARDNPTTKLIETIDKLQVFMNNCGHTICNVTYGSTYLMCLTAFREELAIIVRKWYFIDHCEQCDAPVDEIILRWEWSRKKNYERLTKHKPWRREELPLFDPPDEESATSAVVYAYLGLAAKHPDGRLLKIGYTTEELGKYLKRKEIQHDPKLLATRPGGPEEEKRQLSNFRFHRVETFGREWFFPDAAAIDMLRSEEWYRENNFEDLIIRYLHDRSESFVR